MIVIKMWILQILLKVCDKELATVASLCSSKSFRSHRTLTTVALLEKAAVGGLSRPMHRCMEDKVNATFATFSTISTSMPIGVSCCLGILLNGTEVPKMLVLPRHTFVSQHQAAIGEREVLALDLCLAHCETRAQLVLCWYKLLEFRQLVPEWEEIDLFIFSTRRHCFGYFDKFRLVAAWQEEALIDLRANGPVPDICCT